MTNPVRRPNLVMILTDDHAAHSISAYGSVVNRTPRIDEIGELLGERPGVEHQPPRAGDVRDSQADNSRLRAHFPDVEAVTLKDGLAATLNWFRSLPAYGG